MNNKIIQSKIILVTVLTSLLATTGVVMSDDDEHENRGGFPYLQTFRRFCPSSQFYYFRSDTLIRKYFK